MPRPAPPDDPTAAFLAQRLPLQPQAIARHVLPDGRPVWLKRAGPRHGMAGYRVLGAAARLLGLAVLTPVPNRGGRAAIATEVRRLRTLAAHGVPVPEVLAAAPDGFLMADLGGAQGEATPSLADEMQAAVPAGGATVLTLWQQGLDTLSQVHARGQCLSQAFARNLVRRPDGGVACIDFEDDPAAVLPLEVCQLRDALCYVHSTALYLREAEALPEARRAWGAWLAQPRYAGEFTAQFERMLRRTRWLRHLPADRRWGRDAQRLRAAWELLSGSAP
ncbi:hypothetical protein [Melaminivora alkalimesophila]|uniref:tRNA A-37 threonylcarbamoyl transferase component Bud32 n=1 Tax=Melaminivora alkalimesophila TaxID=1165852 RepID=A0A317RC14_9BURK|nr:hypothetical protein [Melaminivora alkalimesophila]PWW45567.1 hypothetical protein DFR36_10656 [Melaminivora alkalimesophila]